ncbi:MAG: class I SAM-dependent methyltransferase [bacterium]|nr:class I SAM-dependent methyltransferase [bacterium]
MKEGKSSSTAWGVTLARVAHVRFDESPPIFDDSLAFELVEPEIQPILEHYRPVRDPEKSALEEVRRARAYLPLRQRYQEECLMAAYERGVRQFVLLGAGLDAYAFRQPPDHSDLSIFEVDFPATQAKKRARIERLGWCEPANLFFSPCDFERDNLSQSLLRSGFDKRLPCYFTWMGVTVYLERETVRSTFSDLLAISAPGSSIAFEYALPTEDLSGSDLLSRQFSLAQKNREREPFVSQFRLEGIRELVTDIGWKRFEALDHEETAARILAGRNDDLSIHMGFRLAEAFN